MAQATVSSKGSIVIPRSLREKYGIRPAGKLDVLDAGGRLVLFPVPPDPIRAGRGMLRFRGSVRKTLRTFRREEMRRERRKG